MNKIEQATSADSNNIAPLIYDAIGTIAHSLTNETEHYSVLKGLTSLVQNVTNRHSFENTFVVRNEDEILGIIVLYDGKRGKLLDDMLSEKLSYNIDIEAHDDEYYIDTICVSKSARGKGIGTQLLMFAEQQARNLGYKKLSLNVELGKVQARKLYERQGFVVTEPWSINGEPFHHMVKQL